jgi:hypothetical protein
MATCIIGYHTPRLIGTALFLTTAARDLKGLRIAGAGLSPAVRTHVEQREAAGQERMRDTLMAHAAAMERRLGRVSSLAEFIEFDFTPEKDRRPSAAADSGAVNEETATTETRRRSVDESPSGKASLMDRALSRLMSAFSPLKKRHQPPTPGAAPRARPVRRSLDVNHLST